MKKVVYITGTRADYGLMRSTLCSIRERNDMALSLVVTGMHLSHEFGYTVRRIQRDSFNISARIPALSGQDTGAAMVKSFGKFLVRLTEVLEELNPDIVLLLGDKWETMAGAIVGAYMNKLVAHVAGGDVSGSIDEPNRHVITRFSHLHFVATKEHATRLMRMGEEKSRIYVVGAPGLDDIVKGNFSKPKLVQKKYGLHSDRPLFLVVQHPVVAEYENAGQQMETTLKAVEEFKCQTIAIYPNADAGGRRIIKVIKEYQKKLPAFQSHENLSREDFLGLMSVSSVMIGNSSSGLVEAPSFRLPVVNIGTRQDRRIRGNNVIDVGYSVPEIVAAIKKALSREFVTGIQVCKNPYGTGKTGMKIARILGECEINSSILQKRLAY